MRSQIRFVLSDYNADRKDLFTRAGRDYLKRVPWSSSDRYVVDQLMTEWAFHTEQLEALEIRLLQFAESAPAEEAEASRRLKPAAQGGHRLETNAVRNPVGLSDAGA